MAIKVPFVADVAGWLRGTADVVRELGKVSDSLDDITTAGNDADLQVTRDLDHIADSADDSADRLSRSFQDAFDTLEREGRTSTRRIRDEVDDVGHRAGGRGGAFSEFRDEAKQNLAESVASFQGDAESAIDGVQSTFAGLATAFGGIGLAAVTAVGVGIGAIRGMFSEAQEQAAAYKATVERLFEELADNQGTITETFKLEGIKDLIADSDKLKDLFGADDAAEVNKNLAKIGLSPQQTAEIFGGMVGGLDDVTKALGIVNDAQDDWHKVLTDPGVSATAQQQARENLQNLAKIESSLRDSGKAASDASEQAALLDTALGKLPADKRTDVLVTDNGTAKLTQAEINNIKSSGVPVPVHPDMTGFHQSVQKYLNGQKYYVTVQARPGKAVPT